MNFTDFFIFLDLSKDVQLPDAINEPRKLFLSFSDCYRTIKTSSKMATFLLAEDQEEYTDKESEQGFTAPLG